MYDTGGALVQTQQVTFKQVYLYPGWNAVEMTLDRYVHTRTELTEEFSATVALDEVGFSWVFKDFYAQ